MKVSQHFRPNKAVIAAFMLLTVILSGCGGGGGSAGVSASLSNSNSSDTKSNPTGGTTAPVAGCSKTAFVPNYADLMPLYRWGSLPVKVRFINSGLVTKNDGTQADLQQVALEGFREWVTATNNGITLEVTTDPAQASITVHFGMLAGPPTPTDVLGLETSTLAADNSIRSADVLLNTWPSMTSSNIGSFRETSAHEFGHALGINGHSDRSSDVMYVAHPIVTEKGLTDRDVNTLRTGYCNVFGRAATPPEAGGTRTVTNF